jgi:ribosomal protein S26
MEYIANVLVKEFRSYPDIGFHVPQKSSVASTVETSILSDLQTATGGTIIPTAFAVIKMVTHSFYCYVCKCTQFCHLLVQIPSPWDKDRWQSHHS